tara:strand:+ start:858 stop:1118 length:261 start_codon:yes stop_codon:yes gene_type:complete
MDYFTIIGIAVIGIALAFFGIRRRSDAKEEQRIKEFFDDRRTEAIRTGIKNTMDSEVTGINDDLDGDDPARDLAERGNTRNRRRDQ